MYEAYNQHDIAVYAAYLEDNAKLLQSASGGVATALSEWVLSQGGHVAGVAYSEDFRRAELFAKQGLMAAAAHFQHKLPTESPPVAPQPQGEVLYDPNTSMPRTAAQRIS